MPPIEGEITDSGVPQTDTRSTERNLLLSEKVSIGRLVKGKSLRARVVWSEDEERAHSEIMKQVWRKERQP